MGDVIHGVIHGRTIHLEEDPGIGDGQTVEVVVRSVSPPKAWGEGLRRCAGALADYPEMDQYMQTLDRHANDSDG
jgi:hypothetical protein